MSATITLRARWGYMRGKPRPGIWVKSTMARYAYEVVGVREIRKENPNGYRYALECVRHSPADIPAGATVVEWKWDRRSK